MIDALAEIQTSDLADILGASKLDTPEGRQRTQRRDLGLQLILILLDGDEPPETRELAAESVASSFLMPDVLEFIMNRLYSAPLPPEADAAGAIRYAKRFKQVSEFFRELERQQHRIRSVRESWSGLAWQSFGDEAQKRTLERLLTDVGVFRKLVLLGFDDSVLSSARFNVSQISQIFPAFSPVLHEWLSALVGALEVAKKRESRPGLKRRQEVGTFESAHLEREEPAESFAELLEAFEKSHSHKSPSGQKQLQGTVVSLSADQVFLDIGYKTEGVLPRSAFDNDAEAVKPGDSFPVSVTGRNEEGYYELSRFKVAQPRDWSALEAAFAEKTAVVGTVTEVVKGGLRVDLGVRAFMPASRSGTKDAAELEKLVGTEITCRITKLDVQDEDVVVDRRVVLEEQARGLVEDRRAAMKEGDVVNGTIRTLMPYGAFVDIGGIDGLLHISDMAHTRVNKAEDVVAVGQQVQVRILKIDAETKKLSLGLKQLQPEPWATATDRLQAGQRVTGTVTRLQDFGAFVEIEPGIEGLIHISEMSWGKKVRHPSDVVKQGDRVDAVILAIKPEQRRISLGLKHAMADPWTDVRQKFPENSQIEGPVTKIMNFGAFVQLAEGIEGLVHVSEIVADRRINHPSDVLRAGQVVKALVLAIDTDKRQIKLSMKQLVPTSIDEYIAEHKVGDIVSGRVVEQSPSLTIVELGEGIRGTCSAAALSSLTPVAQTEGKADLSALSSLLSARWKGNAPAATVKPEALSAGQIRTFKIVKLDVETKKIAVELA